jgi:heme/copper-type cytochrome/quinol oxidase subunit 1
MSVTDFVEPSAFRMITLHALRCMLFFSMQIRCLLARSALPRAEYRFRLNAPN